MRIWLNSQTQTTCSHGFKMNCKVSKIEAVLLSCLHMFQTLTSATGSLESATTQSWTDTRQQSGGACTDTSTKSSTRFSRQSPTTSPSAWTSSLGRQPHSSTKTLRSTSSTLTQTRCSPWTMRHTPSTSCTPTSTTRQDGSKNSTTGKTLLYLTWAQIRFWITPRSFWLTKLLPDSSETKDKYRGQQQATWTLLATNRANSSISVKRQLILTMTTCRAWARASMRQTTETTPPPQLWN